MSTLLNNQDDSISLNNESRNNEKDDDTLSNVFSDSYSNLHHSKQIQLGGKYVAKGKYGCIFSPNLKCESGRYSGVENDMISKLVSNNNIEFEFDILKSLGLDKIDPQMNYLLYPIDKCRPILSNLKEESDELDKCGLLKMVKLEHIPEDFHNIIIKNGGVSLDNIRRKQYQQKVDYNCEDYCLNYLSLLTGIALLNKNNIYHRDIAHRNLVIDKYGDLRIIDFGLISSKVTNIENAKEDKWNDLIGVYTPELPTDVNVSIDKELNKGDEYPPKVMKTDYFQHKKRVGEFSKIEDKIIVLLQIASELVEEVYQEGDMNWRFSDKQNKSMFITLFEFLVDIHIKKIFKGGKENLNTNIQEKLDVFMIGALLSREIQYCKSNASLFKTELENLAIKMTNLHPIHRISITEALQELVENISSNLVYNENFKTEDERDKLEEKFQTHIQKINNLDLGFSFGDTSDEEDDEEDDEDDDDTISELSSIDS